MNRHGWMRTGLALLFMIVAWFTFCATVGRAQEKPELTWYGYVKLDASWDEGLVNVGNYARWVVSGDLLDEHSHFNMTARQTRLGLTARTKVGSATVNARWESDFYGSPSAENKNALQVRHAYLEVVWPSGWSILAGQASDVISPLVPGTLNYTVNWWVGNIGYRRPQFRITRRVSLSEGKELNFQGAATRTIGDDFSTVVSAVDPGDTGADSGLPTFQGLASVTLPLAGKPMTLGGFVHRGEENLHEELGGEPVRLASSGWGAYLTLPLGSAVTLSGEAWAGLNMDDYLGGIGHGMRITSTRATAVHAHGGWAELGWRGAHTQLRGGFTMDDPDAEDLASGCRDLNTAWWGTLVRDAGSGLTYGVEVSRWETEYVTLSTGRSWRVQGSVIFTF